LSHSPLVRTFLAPVAIAGALALGACDTDGTTPMGGRAFKALPPEMVRLLDQKGMPKESPMVVRVFKQESELEIWKQDNSGRFALLKTYPICRWSGELGPKIKEGDRQAPEGFYDITPAQMNPNSQYYLSFNLGYPNAFDRAHGRSGAHLMVHGDCSSRGCYSMTDEQIGEIYALARESFFGGQKSFQVQAYPFRMTPANFAKHRNNPHMAFWKMLKRGNDHFEVTGMEPKVDVCEKRYVFNAQPRADASTPLSFSAAGRCPAYEVSQDVAAAVNDKQRQDEFKTAELIRRGTPTAPIKTGADGGMHPVFLAKLKQQQRDTLDNDGRAHALAAVNAPGTIPPTVNPPRTPEPEATGTVTAAADVPTPRPAPQRKTGTAPAQTEQRSLASRIGGMFRVAGTESKPAPQARASSGLFGNLFTSDGSTSSNDGVFNRMGRMIGLRGSEAPAEPQPAAASKPAPKAKPVAAAPPARTPASPAKPAPQEAAADDASAKPAANSDQAWPQAQQAAAQAPARPANNASLMSGAQPVMPSSSFDSRFGALR
jgi:murein L,D-transpeptidase YafK